MNKICNHEHYSVETDFTTSIRKKSDLLISTF